MPEPKVPRHLLRALLRAMLGIFEPEPEPEEPPREPEHINLSLVDDPEVEAFIERTQDLQRRIRLAKRSSR